MRTGVRAFLCCGAAPTGTRLSLIHSTSPPRPTMFSPQQRQRAPLTGSSRQFPPTTVTILMLACRFPTSAISAAFCTRMLDGRMFFDVVQRVGGYSGYGEVGAPVNRRARGDGKANVASRTSTGGCVRNSSPSSGRSCASWASQLVSTSLATAPLKRRADASNHAQRAPNRLVATAIDATTATMLLTIRNLPSDSNSVWISSSPTDACPILLPLF